MANGKLKDEDAALAYNILSKNIDKTIGGYKYNQEEGIQAAASAGANENEIAEAEKEWKEKGTESSYFKKWFGKSKVVDALLRPLIVFQGSVQNFSIFDKEKASAEGDMGAGFYFTDNEYDVDSNYYGGGADFDNKVSRLAEKIADEEDIDYDEAKEKAEEQLRGEDTKFEVYLKMENPVYVGGENETNILENIFDGYDAVNEEDYEDYEDYEQARMELEEEALQTISYELDDALGDLLQYEDIEKARGILFEYIYDGVTLQQLKDRLNEEYFENWDTGELVGSEVARRIVEALGYDGIIDSSVSDKFNMDIEAGTTHYIVFNPEQIKSVDNRGTFDASNPNIYYQGAEYKPNFVDWTDKFNGDETTKLTDVRKYINKLIENGNKFATASKDWFIDIKKETSKRKQKRISNKIANEQNFQKLDKQGQIRHNKYVLELEELIKNAEYAPPPKEVKENKKQKKGFVEKYHYFKVNIKVGKNIYEIILDTEQYKGESEERPQTVHLYNIQEKTSGTYADSAYLKKPDASNIITDSESDFNSDVKLYQEGEQYSLFEGNNVAKKIHRVKGGFLPSENFIELFENADESTIIHETGHWFLNTLVARAEYSEEIAQDLEEVRKYLKNTGEPFTREQHEKFARGFEAYILNGNARSNRLKKIFEDFKNWLFAIYDNIKDVGYKIEDMPEVEKLFNRLFSSERERVQKTVFDKCNAIDEQIQFIKDNQEKELDELDTIWRENQEVLNRKQDKKREIDEYLALAKTAAKKEPKELKEYKERYKEATLEILEAATGFDRKFIANTFVGLISFIIFFFINTKKPPDYSSGFPI